MQNGVGAPAEQFLGQGCAEPRSLWRRAANFAGDDPAIFMRGYGIRAELVGTLGRKGFQVEPRRWKVEQTFGCLQRYRRLRVDDESHHDTSRQITVLASVFMIGMRLQRASQS